MVSSLWLSKFNLRPLQRGLRRVGRRTTEVGAPRRRREGGIPDLAAVPATQSPRRALRPQSRVRGRYSIKAEEEEVQVEEVEELIRS